MNIESVIIVALIAVIMINLIFNWRKSNKKDSANAKFDEYQQNVRYKYGYYSLIMLIVILFIDAFLSDNHIWADSMLKWYLLILLPMIYFMTMVVLKGAYIPFNQEELNYKTNISNLLLAFLWLFIGIMQYRRYGMEMLIKNGILRVNLIYFINFFIFSYLAILTYYVYRKNKE